MNPADLLPGAPVSINAGVRHRRSPTREALARMQAALGDEAATAALAGPWTFEGWEGRLARVRCSSWSDLVHHNDLRAPTGTRPPWRRGPIAHPLATRACLLQALVEGPGCGTELVRRVSSRTGGGVTLEQGAVYPTLRSLVAAGLVRAEDPVPNPHGGRPRIDFDLTPQGWEQVRRDRELLTALISFPLPVWRTP